MTMAASTELRVPFLDSDVLEHAAGLPDHFKVSKGQTKRVLKEALRARIPAAVLDRKKAGFPVPYERWLGHELKDFVTDTLVDPNAAITATATVGLSSPSSSSRRSEAPPQRRSSRSSSSSCGTAPFLMRQPRRLSATVSGFHARPTDWHLASPRVRSARAAADCRRRSVGSVVCTMVRRRVVHLCRCGAVRRGGRRCAQSGAVTPAQPDLRRDRRHPWRPGCPDRAGWFSLAAGTVSRSHARRRARRGGRWPQRSDGYPRRRHASRAPDMDSSSRRRPPRRRRRGRAARAT